MNEKLKKRLAKAIASISNIYGKEYWKWRWLPSPKKLGMSDSNALGSRNFGNQPGQPTWEDWKEKVKAMHPIRFFLIEELIPLIKIKWRNYVWEPWYWLKCHVIKRHRYHMLDLRQPKQDGEYAYRYGWLDSDHKMVYALFNILNNFVADEMPHWYCPSEEEIDQNPHLLNQRHKYLEIKTIHYWWNIDRKRREQYYADLLHKWNEARKNQDPAEHQFWIDLKAEESAFKDKEEEMLIRLIKIRGVLWT